MQVTMYCDGGSRGNPGVAGSGSVVYDASGETLAEIAYVVGKKSSNNVAEYYGLIRGLEACAQIGATHVDVFMDSKLVVEQMTGRWKIKHPDMQKLAREARELASGFVKVTYTWVPRAKNKKADELSNVAMDAAARGDKPGIVKGTGVWVGEKAPARNRRPRRSSRTRLRAPRTGPARTRRARGSSCSGTGRHSTPLSGAFPAHRTRSSPTQAVTRRAGQRGRWMCMAPLTPSSPPRRPARRRQHGSPPARSGWTW